MTEAVIVATARSPIGRAMKGSLIECRPDDLGATIVKAALDKVPQLDRTTIDDLILGCGQPAGESGYNLARVTALLAQLEAKAGITKPILIHAILETARGMANVEEVCGASPRMQGLSLGPADLAADRKMKTTRGGGGHPRGAPSGPRGGPPGAPSGNRPAKARRTALLVPLRRSSTSSTKPVAWIQPWRSSKALASGSRSSRSAARASRRSTSS